jgi:hypothetical protein
LRRLDVHDLLEAGHAIQHTRRAWELMHASRTYLNIGTLTVGAVQDLDHHDATRSYWVSLLFLFSRVADQHL